VRAQESQAREGATIHEEMLREADALVVRALSETEARCAVLAQYISDCESRGSRTAAWSGAVRELRALHDYRRGLMRQHSLIEQALEHPVGECPEKTPVPVPSPPPVRRTQQQVQIRAPRRS
jgi:hypothetical protein